MHLVPKRTITDDNAAFLVTRISEGGKTMVRRSAFLLLVVWFVVVSNVDAQSTAFSYQGSLKANGAAANGNYDFEFKLYDHPMVGSQLGGTQTVLNVVVINGVFSVTLDFGNEFSGTARYLEIGVRVAGGPGGYEQLLPRQQIATVPYGIRSLGAQHADTATTAMTATNATNAINAVTAQDALKLGGISAKEYVVTTDPRLSDARPPTAGSASYIQNQGAAPQASSNFNISGTGKAGTFDAATQFNLNGNRILSTPGSQNFFAGLNAGQNITTGCCNSVFGESAGLSNAAGHSNSFFGLSAGQGNSTGSANTFFGRNAGSTNVSGSGNTLIGFFASTGFGDLNNAGAIGNRAWVTASNSLVLGSINGINGATADTNVGIGTSAPSERLHVVGNGLFTGNLNVNGTITGGINVSAITGILSPANGGTGLSSPGTNGNFLKSNGTAWQSAALAASDITSGVLGVNRGGTGLGKPGAGGNFLRSDGTQWQSVALSASDIASGVLVTSRGGTGLGDPGTAGNFLRSNGSVWASSTLTSADIPSNLSTYIQNQNVGPQTSSDFNISGTGAANIFDAGTQFNLAGSPILSAPNLNLLVGIDAGAALSTGHGNVFVGRDAGKNTATGLDNSFFGSRAGELNSVGDSNSFFGERAGASNSSGNENAFFGMTAGASNTQGSNNAYFGFSAAFNSTGSANAFFGSGTGPHHSTGSQNTYLGAGAGVNNTTGNFNTAIGYNTRFNVDTLSYATVIGADATAMRANSITLGRNDGSDDVIVPGDGYVNGDLNVTGVLTANINADSITTGTLAVARGGTGLNAPGASGNFMRSDGKSWTSAPLKAADIPTGSEAYVQNLQLGAKPQNAGFNIWGSGFINGRLGVGTTSPTYRMEVVDGLVAGLRVQTGNGGTAFRAETSGTGGVVASFGNTGIFQVDSVSSQFGRFRIEENGNVSIGGHSFSNPAHKFGVSGTGSVRAVVRSGFPAKQPIDAGIGFMIGDQENWSIVTDGVNLRIRSNFVGSEPEMEIGVNRVKINNHLQLGASSNFEIDHPNMRGGRLEIDGNGKMTIGKVYDPGLDNMLEVRGYIKAIAPPFPGFSVPLCTTLTQDFVTCTSSIRYKKNVANFDHGLDLVSRLRPVSFDWKGDNRADFGLIAEEVAEVEPLLANYDAKGEIQGVKYERIGVVLINAIKEQQAQIEAQQKKIDAQDAAIRELRAEIAKLKKQDRR